MLTGSEGLVRTHLVLQADQVAWLDSEAKRSALGRSGVARLLIRQLQQRAHAEKAGRRRPEPKTSAK